MLSKRAHRSLAIAVAPALVALLVVGCGGSDEAPGGAGKPSVTSKVREGRGAAPAPSDGLRDLARIPMGAPPMGGDGTLSPLDVHDPQIANLEPDLLAAVQAAFDDAAAEGVQIRVNSGWRSREEQQRLLDAAVAEYGSLEEALRYVSTPDTSAHVTGDAVDIGPTDADEWLIQYGDRYGLCQTFANEIWHFELSVEPGESCPQPLPDSSYR